MGATLDLQTTVVRDAMTSMNNLGPSSSTTNNAIQQIRQTTSIRKQQANPSRSEPLHLPAAAAPHHLDAKDDRNRFGGLSLTAVAIALASFSLR